ncbi:MAG: hypothetical protein ACERKJ_05685, partial [Candidatus Dadabacteria bacterium]
DEKISTQNHMTPPIFIIEKFKYVKFPITIMGYTAGGAREGVSKFRKECGTTKSIRIKVINWSNLLILLSENPVSGTCRFPCNKHAEQSSTELLVVE